MTALDHSLCLLRKPVWKFFQGLEYASNQGTDDGDTILSRKRQPPSERPDCLYVIKKERNRAAKDIANLSKPIHENIVALYQVFSHENTISFVYEEMDLSLEQIFLLDIDPWSINPTCKDAQIAAICSQVRSYGRIDLQTY